MRRLARLVRVVDGDTYVLHVAQYGSFERRATIDHHRLHGYRARERYAPAEMDAQGNVVRVSGKDAKAIAESLLGTATRIEVEEVALYPWDSGLVSDVWIDGLSLGTALMSLNVVIPGSARGVEPSPPAT